MKRHCPGWGPWRLDTADLTLNLPRGRYEVDLERMGSSAEILDSIAQVARKQWATPAMVGGLIAAIDDCLGIQAHFCSFGVDRGRQLDTTDLRRFVLARLDWLDTIRSSERRSGGLVTLADIPSPPRWPQEAATR